MMTRTTFGIDVEEEVVGEVVVAVEEGDTMMKMTLISERGDEGSSNIQH